MSHGRQSIKTRPEDTIPIRAPNSATANRWSEARRRRRMLQGDWHTDLKNWMVQMVDERRLDRWRRLDMSKNLFSSIVNQLSVLYDAQAVVWREDGNTAAEEALKTALVDSGFWQIAAHNQMMVLGLREGAIRVHPVVRDGTTRITYSIVTSDVYHAVASPDTPDEPHTGYHYRLRPMPESEALAWTRDAFSIVNPEQPTFRVEDPDGEDVTEKFPGVERLIGDDYVFRFADGTPYIPMPLYHALRTGRLFDWTRGVELVDGSLQVAGYWSLWGHILRDASFPQRYLINAEIQGAEVKGDSATVLVDPAAVVSLHSRPGEGPPSAGQWQPGGDVEAVGRAIQSFASDLAGGFDISPNEIKRVHGDAARSGYAIEVTKEGQRNAQRKYAPQFMRADLQLLSQTAALLGLPDTGWSIRYTGVPSTFSERQLLIDEYRTRVELGLSSPVDVLAALDDISEDDARAKLRRFRTDNAEFTPRTPGA